MRIKYSPALLLPLFCLTACDSSKNNTQTRIANDLSSMETVSAENDIFVFLNSVDNEELTSAFYTNLIIPELPGVIAETFFWSKYSQEWTALDISSDGSGTTDSTGKYFLTPTGWQHFTQQNIREASFDEQGALVMTSSYGDFQLTYKYSISEEINLEDQLVNSLLKLSALSDSPSVFPQGAKQYTVSAQGEDEYSLVSWEFCVSLIESGGRHECRADYVPVLIPGAEQQIKNEDELWQIPTNLTLSDIPELKTLYSQESDNWLTLPLVLGDGEHSIHKIQLTDNLKLNLKEYNNQVEGKIFEQQGELEPVEVNGEQLYLIRLPDAYRHKSNNSVLFLTEHNQKVYFGMAYLMSEINWLADQTFVNKITLDSLKLEIDLFVSENTTNENAQINQNEIRHQFKF